MAESLAIKTLLTVAVNYGDEEKGGEEETTDNGEVGEVDEVDIEKNDLPDDEEVSGVWE